MTSTNQTITPAPNVHRLEVAISGGRSHGLLNGDITFKGVCDAVEGAPCRMWCNDPDCREEAREDHDRHVLADQGECGVIGTLNADPSMIPELYEGPAAPLRSGAIELTQDIDGVTWQYAEEPLTDLELLQQGRRLVAHGVRLVDYANQLTEYHGHLNALTEVLVGGPLVDVPVPPPGPTPSDAPAPSHPGCAENCRHECGECRLGLGTHRICDPRCDHYQPAPSR
jgi:hypothetical protein